MALFKPAEIRIILFLSFLAIAGSVVTLLQRYNKLSQLELNAFAPKGEYRYSYTPSDPAQPDTSEAPGNSSPSGWPAPAQPDESGEKIDLNHAGLYDFESLPGIGPVLAAKIIAHRDSVGGFKSIDDLLEVKGIGPAKYSAIKNKVYIE
jgi:competence protein ComEA